MPASKKGLVSEYPSHNVRMRFAFRIDTGNAPDAVRDSDGGFVDSVARTAAGRYLVTLKRGLSDVPRQLTYAVVQQHNPDEAPTAATFPAGGYVKNLSISAQTATTGAQFEVNTIIENAGGAHAVGEPEDATWVTVDIEGPAIDAMKDAV